MRWLRLKRSKIKVFGRKGKTLPKGFQEEHTSFLHSLLTNDIKGLKPFSFNYNLWLKQNGFPIEDFFVYKLEDAYLLDTEGDAKRIIEEFERLKLSLRVYFEDLTENYHHIFIFGEGAKEWVKRIFGSVPEEGKFFEKDGIFVANNPLRLREEGFDIFGTLNSLELPVGREISQEDFEGLRIEKKIPKIGKELRDGYSPLEAGLLNVAISLTKGCYVGQEVIARIHYKGRLPRTLALFEGENLQEGQKIFDGEKEVGLITSVSKKGLALGYILLNKLEEKREFATDKAKVIVLN